MRLSSTGLSAAGFIVDIGPHRAAWRLLLILSRFQRFHDGMRNPHC